MKEEPKIKYFFVNKRNKQVTISITKVKPHPVKTLIRILNANASKLDFDGVSEDERKELIEFIEYGMELFKL